MVERHRDERVPLAGLGMFVKGLGQPSDQPPLLVIFVPVLEADNRVEDLPLRAITRSRPLEMPLFLQTMVANESRVVACQGGVGITALLAKRPLDPHRFRLRILGPGKGQIQGALAPIPRVGSGETEG